MQSFKNCLLTSTGIRNWVLNCTVVLTVAICGAHVSKVGRKLVKPSRSSGLMSSSIIAFDVRPNTFSSDVSMYDRRPDSAVKMTIVPSFSNDMLCTKSRTQASRSMGASLRADVSTTSQGAKS